MGNRRRSRELAMQALFYVDMRQNKSKERLDLYLQSFKPSKKVLPFFLELVNGVIREGDQIDAMIERFSSNWKMSRMSCVDRNIMRVAIFELLYKSDIPPSVTINEAVEVGKKFGTRDSGPFINGILDRIKADIQ